MSVEEFSAYQTRHMLLAVRNWLRAEEHRTGTGRDGYMTMDAETAESLGSNLGLDKPSSHRMLVALFEAGYLDGDYASSGSGSIPLRFARIRGMTRKALEEMG